MSCRDFCPTNGRALRNVGLSIKEEIRFKASGQAGSRRVPLPIPGLSAGDSRSNDPA